MFLPAMLASAGSLPHARFRNATFPQFSESLGVESVCNIVVVFVRRPLDHAYSSRYCVASRIVSLATLTDPHVLGAAILKTHQAL